MFRRQSARNLLVAAFAGGGVLAAHWLGYRWAAHHAHGHEHELLANTGHSYFTYFIAAVAALTALLLWRYVSAQMEKRQGPDVSGIQLCAQAGIRLIPLQAIAFLVLELGERTIATGGLTNVLTEPAVLMGLFFQVVVGVIGAVLIAAFAGVVEMLRRRTWSVTPSKPLVRIYPKAHSFKLRTLSLAEGGLGLRGPPSLL